MRCIQHTPADHCDIQQIARSLSVPRAQLARELHKTQLEGIVRAERSEHGKRENLFPLTSLGISTLEDDPMVMIANSIAQFPVGEQEKFEQSVRELALRLLGELGRNREISPSGNERT